MVEDSKLPLSEERGRIIIKQGMCGNLFKHVSSFLPNLITFQQIAEQLCVTSILKLQVENTERSRSKQLKRPQ